MFAVQIGMSISQPRLPSASDLRAAFLACLRAHEACEAAVTHVLRRDDGERLLHAKGLSRPGQPIISQQRQRSV